MQVSPAYSTRILASVALLVLGAACVALDAGAFAWSAAIVVGLAVSRLLTQFSMSRARSAGFEMLWQHPSRNLQTVRGSEVVLCAELRNRSAHLLVLDTVAAMSPPTLATAVEPARALLPAHSALPVKLRIRPLRVGLQGVQGLTVVVRSDVSAFEAQLTFANPFVLEVLPSASAFNEPVRRGGLGRIAAPADRTGMVSGESLELRELRDYQPGDALRKIAWKATARRGRLLARDDEQEHRNLVWFVLDASVELWAGLPSIAPLDDAIDRVASLIHHSVRRGDRVGLRIVAARRLAEVAPDQGTNHERRLFEALAHATSALDADRSGLDETDAAAVVLEHLRPLDPTGTRRLSSKDLDEIARLAHRALAKSQLVARPEPAGPSARDRLFRRYIATFGLPTAPRSTTDRDVTDRELVETIKALIPTHPDRIRLCSPWPRPRLVDGLSRLRARMKRTRIQLDWIPINVHAGVTYAKTVEHQIVQNTLAWREMADAAQGRRVIRRLGVHEALTFRPSRSDRTPSADVDVES